MLMLSYLAHKLDSKKGAIEKLAAGRKKGPIPVEVIDMRDYGTMNGKAVFEMARKLIGD